GIAAKGTGPAGGGYCRGYCTGGPGGVAAGAAAGATPAAAIWSAPHFGQKRSPFANWFPQLAQNAMPLPSHIFQSFCEIVTRNRIAFFGAEVLSLADSR